MTDALQQAIEFGAPTTGALAPTSRYYRIGTNLLKRPGSEPIVYLRRRFLPPPERFVPYQEHVVAQGDRLDNITAQFLGDPEQFWRLCDPNRAMRPEELETIGRQIVITLPEGIPGASRA